LPVLFFTLEKLYCPIQQFNFLECSNKTLMYNRLVVEDENN